MRFIFLTILLIALPLVVPEYLVAETPVATTPAIAANKPGKGMSMRQVERKFGTPEKKLPATGKPPITRWIYADFTVYFEDKYVIHSVTQRKRPARQP